MIVRRRSARCWSRRICSTTARRSRSLFVLAMGAGFSGSLGRAVRRREVYGVARRNLTSGCIGVVVGVASQPRANAAAAQRRRRRALLPLGARRAAPRRRRPSTRDHRPGAAEGRELRSASSSAEQAAPKPRGPRAAQRGEHRLAGAEPEHVLLLGAHQCGGARRRGRPAGSTRSARPRTTAARPAVELALDQVGGRGELVGDRRGGDRQLVAVLVGAPGVVVQHVEAGGADRDVGLPVAPGPAGGVGDQHRDVAPGASRRPARGAVAPRRRGRPAAAPRCPARCWTRRCRRRPSPARGGCARSTCGRGRRRPGRSRRPARPRGRRTAPGPRPCSPPCW